MIPDTRLRSRRVREPCIRVLLLQSSSLFEIQIGYFIDKFKLSRKLFNIGPISSNTQPFKFFYFNQKSCTTKTGDKCVKYQFFWTSIYSLNRSYHYSLISTQFPKLNQAPRFIYLPGLVQPLWKSKTPCQIFD